MFVENTYRVSNTEHTFLSSLIFTSYLSWLGVTECCHLTAIKIELFPVTRTWRRYSWWKYIVTSYSLKGMILTSVLIFFNLICLNICNLWSACFLKMVIILKQCDKVERKLEGFSPIHATYHNKSNNSSVHVLVIFD